MNNLTIASVKNLSPAIGWIDVCVDRRSHLGNPFPMSDESMRSNCCAAYEEYLWGILTTDQEPDLLGIASRHGCPVDTTGIRQGKYKRSQAIQYFDQLLTLLRQGKRLRLICHCHPKQCHADFIAEYLMLALNNDPALDRRPRKEITLYTDGSCVPNPGAGGWGAVLIYGDSRKELSGYEADTTNSRMELTAVVEGLRAINQPVKVKLYSDSKYVVDGMTHFINNWAAKGWRGIKNSDLWKEIYALMNKHRIEAEWVPAHSGVVENERCDRLAANARKEGSMLHAIALGEDGLLPTKSVLATTV